MADITSGTKLFFKNGLQSKYDALTSRDAGTFYVTSDTHRLYLGDNLLSQAVVTVNSVSDLTSSTALKVDGQIAYVKDGNILCIYDTTKGDWAQLNPDTAIAAFDQSVEIANNIATVTTEITENRGAHAATAWSDSFKITGANGTKVSASGDTVTVGLEDLALANGDNTVTLAVGTSNNKITIKGAGDTTVSAAENGLTISTTANDYRVVADNNTKLTLASESAGFSLEGQVVLKDKNHADSASETVEFVGASIDPTISVGKAGNSQVHFVNGDAVVDTYTQKEITDKIAEAKRQMNAMTYMGKLDENNGLPSEKVQIGDTYMVAKAGAYISGDSKVYPVGTLIVAKGTEDETTGYITSGLGWDAVQASDTDTTYILTGSGEDKAIILKSSLDQEQNLNIKDDGIVTTAITTSASGEPTLTINHGAVAHTASTGTAINSASGVATTLNYVSAVTINEQGHVTDVQTTSAKFVDTINDNASWSINSASNGATLTFTVTDSNKSSVEDEMTLASSSLLIAGDTANKKVSVDLVWGTF
jgi:hypothetical protein